MKKRRIRINVMTKTPLQLKYLAIFIVAMVVPALIVGGSLYYLIFTMTAEQIGIPEAIVMNLIPVVKKINFILVVSLVPLFSLLVFWGLALSNKFCGPLKRIEGDLDRILSGDYSLRLRVREGDDIKSIVDKLNKLLDVLRNRK